MERFVRMRRSGLPDGAIANVMAREGVNAPPGFFPDDVAVPAPAHIVVVAAAKQPTAASPPSLADALKGFDRTKLKAASAEEEQDDDSQARRSSGGGGIADALAGFDRSALRKAPERSVEEKKDLAAKGQAGFGAVFAKAIEGRRQYIQESDEEEVGEDDEWAM
jgi:hypothetical protein